MKKIVYTGCIILALGFESCAPDKADDPLSPSPTADSRDKYAGTWVCSETSKVSGNTSYPVSISKSTTNASEIIINRFYDIASQDVRAGLSGNTITIPFQTLTVVNGFAKGSGSVSSGGTTMSLAYTTTITSTQDTCTATYTKQ